MDRRSSNGQAQPSLITAASDINIPPTWWSQYKISKTERSRRVEETSKKHRNKVRSMSGIEPHPCLDQSQSDLLVAARQTATTARQVRDRSTSGHSLPPDLSTSRVRKALPRGRSSALHPAGGAASLGDSAGPAPRLSRSEAAGAAGGAGAGGGVGWRWGGWPVARSAW